MKTVGRYNFILGMWFLQKSIRLLPHSRDSLKFCEMYHVSHQKYTATFWINLWKINKFHINFDTASKLNTCHHVRYSVTLFIISKQRIPWKDYLSIQNYCWILFKNDFRTSQGVRQHFRAIWAHLNGSVKEPNISIYFIFFRPSLNGVLFPMFCLLVEGECQILVF